MGGDPCPGCGRTERQQGVHRCSASFRQPDSGCARGAAKGALPKFGSAHLFRGGCGHQGATAPQSGAQPGRRPAALAGIAPQPYGSPEETHCDATYVGIKTPQAGLEATPEQAEVPKKAPGRLVFCDRGSGCVRLALRLEASFVGVPGIGAQAFFPQLELLDLVGRGIGQFVDKLDEAGDKEVGRVVVDVARQLQFT